MILKLALTAMIVMFVCGVGVQEPQPKTHTTYGDAVVSSVLRLDEQVRLHCNIEGFPAVIGEDVPVRIHALKPAENAQDNLKLLMYLNDLLLSKDNAPQTIVLSNIQRGEQFCLVADVQVDGLNLCDLVVEQGLARKVIEVPQQSRIAETGNQAPAEASPAASAGVIAGAYVASTSGKVYHRPSCSHAKRMDASKVVSFATREEAEQSGRRPCKTCKP